MDRAILFEGPTHTQNNDQLFLHVLGTCNVFSLPVEFQGLGFSSWGETWTVLYFLGGGGGGGGGGGTIS